MVEAYGGTRGVCVNQAVGHVGLDARCKGFIVALTEAGLEAEVLAVSNDPAEAATTMEDYYTANPDVDLWLTGTEWGQPLLHFHEKCRVKSG
jgi:simple sugar transport system substrate-binding protein